MTLYFFFSFFLFSLFSFFVVSLLLLLFKKNQKDFYQIILFIHLFIYSFINSFNYLLVFLFYFFYFIFWIILYTQAFFFSLPSCLNWRVITFVFSYWSKILQILFNSTQLNSFYIRSNQISTNIVSSPRFLLLLGILFYSIFFWFWFQSLSFTINYLKTGLTRSFYLPTYTSRPVFHRFN